MYTMLGMIHSSSRGDVSLDARGKTLYKSETPEVLTMNEHRILVLEDDDETLAFMSLVLRAQGYEVYERDLLLEHFAEVKYLAPSLMIVDVFQHAKPIGWEFIQTLKAHAATASIPIILYTAGSLTPEQLHQSQHQGIPVVYKPFDLTELLHLVESLTH